MTLMALSCILFAAWLHATWNFLAQRVRGGVPFIWLCDLCGVLLLTPIVLLVANVTTPIVSVYVLGTVAVSGLLQVAYLCCLQRGYEVGTFSVVYPLARGTGSGMVVLGSSLLLGERLTLPTMLGASCMIIGSALIASTRSHPSGQHVRTSVFYGLMTGLWIASYTLWDKVAVSVIGLTPIFFYYGTLLVRVGVLTPVAVWQWPRVSTCWQTYRRVTISVAVLSAFSYIVVLSVLTFTAVHAVAPAREVSILFGTLMGQHFLTRAGAVRRVLGASLFVLGISIMVVGMQ